MTIPNLDEVFDPKGTIRWEPDGRYNEFDSDFIPPPPPPPPVNPPPPPGPILAVAAYRVTVSNTSPNPGATITVFAQALDQFNQPFFKAGLVLTWSESRGNGLFSNSASITDSSGVALVNFTVRLENQTYQIIGTDSTGRLGASPIITVVNTPIDTTPFSITLSD